MIHDVVILDIAQGLLSGAGLVYDGAECRKPIHSHMKSQCPFKVGSSLVRV